MWRRLARLGVRALAQHYQPLAAQPFWGGAALVAMAAWQCPAHTWSASLVASWGSILGFAGVCAHLPCRVGVPVCAQPSARAA